ncbi:LAETG motif-containing sortase-dependent surface protein [Streptomyces californicus]|uniref:LAETG motif-containing sortase-dependent surface protein n=1 Tax=Streptomyces californicus TaxID=67351 RepID=UPI00368D19CE
MKIRRALATAVALAVTTPAALLAVSPAYADTKPVTQTQEKKSKPTVKELEAAAAEAKKAYEKAAQAKADGHAALEKTLDELGTTHPLAVTAAAAKQAAKDAADAKTAADQAVTDAKAALAALPEDATAEKKAEAEAAVTEAETTAATAATAKTAADAKATEAGTALEEARVAAFRTYHVLDKAADDALAAKIAADAALAKAVKEAEEEEEEEGDGDVCEFEDDLSAEVTGLPNKLVAGTTTNFTLRVTNGSDQRMDEINAYTGVFAADKSGIRETGKFFHLQWSTKSSPKWQNADEDHYIDGLGPLKPGGHADVKLRLTLDQATPAGNGVAFIAADFYNEDGDCGGMTDLDMYEFDVKAAGSKPGKTENAKPSKTTKPGAGNTGTAPLGSSSGTPAQTGTGGSLAATGSSSATSSIALAGGAAVLLGAAAVFVVRRRKAGSAA